MISPAWQIESAFFSKTLSNLEITVHPNNEIRNHHVRLAIGKKKTPMQMLLESDHQTSLA